MATLALCVAGCSMHRVDYACAVPAETATVDPHAAWACHREIVDRAARGREFSVREFREAAAFFEGLTGIGAGLVETPAGPIPGHDLKQRLRAWDVWYEDNRDGLYWDPATRHVRFAPEAGAHGRSGLE